MSNKKNLLIYAHYYIPDTASTGQILRELAEGMLDKFNITVICVVPSYLGTIEDKYKTQKYYEEEINGVKVLRIRVPEFSKRYTFLAMNMNESSYINSPQISGSFMAFKKSCFTEQFVTEWLEYCCNKEILEPPKDRTDEYDDFVSHREDQSILSLLIKKYNIKCYEDPSQFGKVPEKYAQPGYKMLYYSNKDYSPFIIHHRTSDANLKVIFRQIMCIVLPRSLSLKMLRTR